jgi:hypothetical protein
MLAEELAAVAGDDVDEAAVVGHQDIEDAVAVEVHQGGAGEDGPRAGRRVIEDQPPAGVPGPQGAVQATRHHLGDAIAGDVPHRRGGEGLVRRLATSEARKKWSVRRPAGFARRSEHRQDSVERSERSE